MKVVLIDSGIGGVSVLNQMIAQYPKLSVVYLADYQNMPYGDKKFNTLVELAHDLLSWAFEKQKANKVIIACNTLSIVLKQMNYVNENCITMLDLAKATNEQINGTRVNILATNYTIKSKVFEEIFNVNDAILGQNLAQLLERGDDQGLKQTFDAMNITKHYPLVLLCTHYPLIKDIFKDYQIIDPGCAIKSVLGPISSTKATINLYSTDNRAIITKFKNMIKGKQYEQYYFEQKEFTK